MIKKRIISGISGNVVVQAINMIVQVFGIPLMIKYWGMAYYGEWLILFSIPSYIAISDMGLGTSTTAELSMLIEGGKRKEAGEVLRNVFWFIVAVGGIPFYLLLASVFIFPWYDWLGLNAISSSEFNLTFIFLILYIFLALFLTLPLGYYRVEKAYHVERYISAIFKLIEFILVVVFIMLGFKVLCVAAIYLSVRLLNFIFVIFDLYRRFPHFKLFPFSFGFKRMKYLLKPALTVMTIYMGQNFMVQGMTTLIGLYLGSTQVVIFNSSRVLVNVTKQLVSVVNLSFFSEFSYAFGKQKIMLLRNLYQKTQLINIVLSLGALGSIFLAKGLIMQYWLGGKVEIVEPFFFLLLLGAFVNINWNVPLTLIGATNKQENIGIYFVIASLLAVVINILFLKQYGLQVVSVSILLFETIMLGVSCKYAMKILQLNFNGYFKLLTDFN